MHFLFLKFHHFFVKASIPVIPLPTIKAWISFVPSYVFTVSKFIACLNT